MPDISEDLRKIKEAIYGEEVRDSIHNAIKDINDVCEGNVETVTRITNQGIAYRDAAGVSATNAAASATEATTQATNANTSATKAANQATNAASSAAEATNQATTATTQATNAANSATEATTQATNAANSATSADSSKTAARTSELNAEQWYNKAKQVAETMGGPTRLLGTIPFADLPSVSDSVPGDMWNISDTFTTTADFEEGAGHNYSAGCNVYLTNNNKWDVQVSDYGEVLVAIDEIINGALVLPEEM
jgi:hypothetical protein